MLATIENLREISRLCLANEPLDTEMSNWLGASLERFIKHQCQSLDAAFDLKFPRGGVPWWMEEAIRARDAALRDLADRFCGACSVQVQAQSIRSLSLRYAASAWRFDRSRGEMPAHYAKTPKEYLWRAFKSGAAMPISERHLRTILAP